MRKSLKENIELPQINRNIKFQICKEKEFAKPKLQRIVYSPPSSPSRLLVNMTILESMISKVSSLLSRNPTRNWKTSGNKNRLSNCCEKPNPTWPRRIGALRDGSESKHKSNIMKIIKSWINCWVKRSYSRSAHFLIQWRLTQPYSSSRLLRKRACCHAAWGSSRTTGKPVR